MAGGSIEVQVYDFKYYDNYSSTALAISEITDKVPLLLLLMSREGERMAYLLIIDYLRHTFSLSLSLSLLPLPGIYCVYSFADLGLGLGLLYKQSV